MNIKKIFTNTYQIVCLTMVMLFSLLPAYAILGPKKYGSYFMMFEDIEITALFLCFIIYLLYKLFTKCFSPKSNDNETLLEKITGLFINNKQLILFVIMFVFIVISASRFPDNKNVLEGKLGRPDGLKMYMCFFALFIFSFSLKSPYLKKFVIGTYIFSFILVSLVMLLQYYGMIGSANEKFCPDWGWTQDLKNYFQKTGIRLGQFYRGETGSFFNLNHMGYYITLCSCLFTGLLFKEANTVKKVLLSFLCAYSYWILIINNTFGAFLAVVGTISLFTILYIIKFSHDDKDKDKSRKFMVLSLLAFMGCFVLCFYWIYLAQTYTKVLIGILFTVCIIGFLIFCFLKFLKFRYYIIKFISVILPVFIFVTVSITVSKFPFDSDEPIIVRNIRVFKSDTEKIANSSDGFERAGSGRADLWIASFKLIKKEPVLGFGPDNVKSAYAAEKSKMDRAHCEPLEIAVSAGIPAALCYVFSILYVIYKNIRKKNLFSDETGFNYIAVTMAVCGYFISGLVGVFLFYTACHMFVMLGLASGYDD